MFFEKSTKIPEVFRRNWGVGQSGTVSRHDIALDAITPSFDDCSMRIICREAGGYAVSIAFYSDIYFSLPIKAIRSVTLSQVAMDELLAKGHIIPFSFFGVPSVDPRMWAVSDTGEQAWARMIGN